MRRVVVALVALIGAALCGVGVVHVVLQGEGRQALPTIVVPAKPLQETDLSRETDAYNQRTLAGYYPRHQKSRPSWDPIARQLLADYTAMLALRSDCRVGEGCTNSALKQVAALEKTDCDDALIQLVAAEVLLALPRPEQARPHLEAARRAQAKRPYPLDRMFLLPYEELRASPDMPVERRLALLDESAATFAKLAAQRPIPGGERYLFRRMVRWFGALDRGYWPRLLTAIEAEPKADRWLALMLRGMTEVQLAWVTNGWEASELLGRASPSTVRLHAQAANQALREAYRLHPERPEAACELISLAMGGLAEPGETPALWFERAIAAQIDEASAYDGMTIALLPRWGGSHRQLTEFALACLNTKRYDTDVPWQALQIAQTVWMEDDVELFRNDRLYHAFEQAAREYARREPESTEPLSLLLAVAARSERWADALKLREELGPRVNRSMLGRMTRDGDGPALLRAVREHAEAVGR